MFVYCLNGTPIVRFSTKKGNRFMIVTIVADVLGDENNGTTIACMNLVRYLKQSGDTVRVLCCDEDRLGQEGFYVVPVRNLGFILNKALARNNVTLAKPDKRIIRKALEGADVCHVMIPFSLGKMAIKMAKKMNVPISMGFHCQAENFTAHFGIGMYSKFFNKFMYHRFYSTCYKKVDAVHYPTEFIRNTFEKEVKHKTNACVISNGVNSQFKRMPVENREAPFDKHYNILFIGRYCKEKSQKTLIQAVAKSKYKDNIQLVFAGQGPDRNNMVKLANKLDIIPPILGFYGRDELVKIINSCDLYVHASEIEIEAISALEAISCGLVPVISDSDKSATKQFALDKKNLFKNRDADDLARKIDYWIENEEEKEKYQKRYENFSKGFEQDVCMLRMREMLQSIRN